MRLLSHFDELYTDTIAVRIGIDTFGTSGDLPGLGTLITLPIRLNVGIIIVLVNIIIIYLSLTWKNYNE